MPYTGPQVQSHAGEYMLQAASKVGQDIEEAFKRYNEDREQRGYNDVLFSDPEVRKHISPELQQKYLKGNIRDQSGIILGAIKSASFKQAAEDQELQRRTVNQGITEHRARILRDALKDQEEGTMKPIIDPETGQRVPHTAYVRGANQIIDTGGKQGKQAQDTWGKLASDVNNLSGYKLSDWIKAKASHRKETINGEEYIAADPPADASFVMPPGVDPKTYATVQALLNKDKKSAGVMQMPKRQFDEMTRRFDDIQGRALGEAEAPAQQQSAPVPQQSAGRQYSRQDAMNWLRNNPNDPNAAAVRRQLGL